MVLASRGDKSLHDRLATRAGIQISALRLEDSPLDSFEVNLGPAFLHLRRREFVKLDLRVPQRFDRSSLEGVIASRSHPEDSGAVQELALPLALVLCPQLERPSRHLRVRLIGPYVPRMTRVSPPEDAREFPGPQASSSVTRAPRSRRCRAVQPPKAPAPITAM